MTGEQPDRVAYLNTEYPSLSHTFIEREIRAVRAHGVRVETFSIRRSGSSGRLGSAHQQAAEETTVVLDGAGRVLLSAALEAVSRPLSFLRTIVRSQRISPPGLASRTTHVAYALEAVRLVRLLRARGLSHVHVHMGNNGAMVALLACVFDRRLTYSLTVHGPAEFYRVDTLRLKEKAEHASFVSCISEFCRAQVMTFTSPACWERLHIVHCGVDPAVFEPAWSRAPGPFRLLTVGRLAPVKGHAVLLAALARARAAGVDASLEIIGSGPEQEAIERRIGELGLEDHVRLLGPRSPDEVVAACHRADAMVLSSFMEGVPVVLMEAMACGLPVVASRIAGIPELIEHEKSGILTSAGSVGEVAGAIERLARDPELCRRMGEAGIARVRSDFNIRTIGAQMATLLRPHAARAAIGARPTHAAVTHA